MAELQEMQVEKALLGGFLLDNQWEHIDRLKPELFTTSNNQTIAQIIKQLYAEGKPYDLVSVQASLNGKIDRSSYLNELLDTVVTTASTEYYLDILEDRQVRRAMGMLSAELLEKSKDKQQDKNELLVVVESMSEKLLSCTINNIKTIENIIDIHLGNIVRKFDGPVGISTGFKTLDDRICGLSKGVYIIAGRPGMGKTTFAINWILNQATKGHTVGFISLEMASERVLMWMLDWKLKTDHQYVSSTSKKGDRSLQITAAAKEIKELKEKIVIDDTAYYDVAEVVSSAYKMRFKHKIEVLYIDYLQLLESRGSRDTREREVATISRRLTALKKQLDIPIVLLSQLNRSSMTSEDKRPKLHHLRESGAIEQDADVVLLLYDPKKIGEHHEVHIAKNRSGPVTSKPIAFRFDKAAKRFSEGTCATETMAG